MKSKLFTLLFFLFVLGIIYLANMGGLPKEIRRIYDFPYGDKIGHFFLMGILSFSVNWTVFSSTTPSKSIRLLLWATFALTFFVTLEEFSQCYFPRRTFSLADLLFSYAGIFLGALLVWKLRKSIKDRR
jgi:VanZ family protein